MDALARYLSSPTIFIFHQPLNRKAPMPLPQGILNSALDAIGQTPLIRLDRIARAEGLKCNLLAKAEFLSVGGSVKDRIAKRMVEEAERTGRLIPGQTTVIEATSGNTGIGLGLACALKGYPLIITLPEKMSLEKEATLRALGAEIVRTPTTAAFDSPESHIGVAKRLQQKIPNSVILNQYSNVDNPLAHELTTGPEIIDAIVVDAHSINTTKSSGQVDAIVVGAGTGGTITGISRAIKKAHNPECVVVGVDPKGSVLAYPDTLNNAVDDASYQVEGIGYDFIPDVLDRMAPTVDVWLKIGDDEAFPAAMRLIKEEALLVGGSSGTALAGTLKWLKTEEGRVYAEKEGSNIVVVLPDGIRNYMSKSWFLGAATKHAETSLSKTIKQAMAPDS